MKKSIFTILSFCLTISLFAQKDVKFTATLEKEEIGSEEYVKVTFSIENGAANGFVAPEFEDFDEVYGPNTTTQMSFMNGKLTQSASYTYTLRPKDKGTFVIEPAKLKVGEEILTTEHLKVKVLEEPTTPKRFQPKSKEATPKKPKTKRKRKIYKI